MRLYETAKGSWGGGEGYHGQHLPKPKPTDAYELGDIVSTDFDTDEYAIDPINDIENEIDRKKMIEFALAGLTEREQLVTIMYFGLRGRAPMSYAQVGAAINKYDPEAGVGVGQERVHQIIAKVLRKLRHPSRQLDPINEASIFDERTLQNTKWNHPKQLMAWLRKNGFRQMGKGSFGAAFIKPGYNRIVKISNRQDDCWLRFAKWALSRTSNPALPDISWVKTYQDHAGEKFFIAVVEKLAPFNQKAINETVDLPGLVYMFLHEDWFQGDPEISKRLAAEGFLQTRSDGRWIDDDSMWPRERGKLLKYLREVSGGKRFILTLKAAENKATGRCSYDMHDGNIMYRPKDKRLVLIDPLADMAGGGYYF